MDRLVELEIASEIATCMVSEHLVVQRADLVDLGVGRVHAGKFPGQRIQRAHDGQGLRQPHRVQLRDDSAAIRQQLDQAFRGEYLEGLAQRGAGQTQLGGQQAFVQPGACNEAPLDDQVAQAVRGLLVEGPADDGGCVLQIVHFVCRIQNFKVLRNN